MNHLGDEPEEMGDNLPVVQSFSTTSPSRSPSRNPTTTATQGIKCKKWDRNSQECASIPGCRYVFPTNDDFKRLKSKFIKNCMNLGDFGCRAQYDCAFKCRRLRTFDSWCKRLGA